MVFTLSSLIGLQHILTSPENLKFGHFCAMIMLLIVTMMPTVLIILTCARHSNLKNKESRDFKLWGGSHIKNLNTQIALTDADSKVAHAIQKYKLGKLETIVYAYGAYFSYLLTAYVIVFMRDVPAI